MQNTIAKDTLREYVMRNEVVFQAYGDLREQKRVSFLSYDELDRQYENALADSQRGFIL